MPDSILRQSDSYLYTKAMDGPYVAVLCDSCLEGHIYKIEEFRDSGISHTPEPFRNGELNLFSLPLQCDKENCDIHKVVFAPKLPDVTEEDVAIESESWTLSGIQCSCGGAVTIQQPSTPFRIALDPDAAKRPPYQKNLSFASDKEIAEEEQRLQRLEQTRMKRSQKKPN